MPVFTTPSLAAVYAEAASKAYNRVVTPITRQGFVTVKSESFFTCLTGFFNNTAWVARVATLIKTTPQP